MAGFRLRSYRRSAKRHARINRLALITEGLTLWAGIICVVLVGIVYLGDEHFHPMYVGFSFGVVLGWLITMSVGVGEGVLIHVLLDLTLGFSFGYLFLRPDRLPLAVGLTATCALLLSCMCTREIETRVETIGAGVALSLLSFFFGLLLAHIPLEFDQLRAVQFTGQDLQRGVLLSALFSTIYFRLFLLPLETIHTWLQLRSAQRHPSVASAYLTRSVAYWDELNLFRQPFLTHFLVLVGKQNRIEFLKAIAHLSSNTYQQRVANDAVIKLTVSDLMNCQTIQDIAHAHQDLIWLAPTTTKWTDDPPLELVIGETDSTVGDELITPDRGSTEKPKGFIRSLFQWLLDALGLSARYVSENTLLPTNVINSSYLDDFRELGVVAAADRCRQISEDVSAAVAATSNYQKQIAFNRARRQLDALLRFSLMTLNSTAQRVFSQIVYRWLDLVNDEIDLLTEEERTEKLVPNPYIAPRPLSPGSDVFVGRTEDFRFVEEHFLRQGDSLAIVIHGQPRIGKSSLLRHFVNNLPTNFFCIYLDMQRLAQVESTAGLLFNLSDIVAQALTAKGLKISSPQLSDYKTEPFILFGRFLDVIENQLTKFNNRLILAFDEFEEIDQKLSDGKVSSDFLPFLRNMMQHRPYIGLIFAGTHKLDEMISQNWIPYFRSAVSRRIGYLDEMNARRLITNPINDFPLNYDVEAVDMLIQVTSCHPCLIQLACSSLVQLKNEQRSHYVSCDDMDQALGKALQAGDYVFRGLWDWIPTTERRLLTELASLDSNSDLLNVDQNRQTSRLLNRLIQNEIIQRESADSRPERFAFQVELFRRWIAAHRDTSLAQ